MRALIHRLVIAMFLVLAVSSGAAMAQDAATLDTLSQAIDCTPICGSRFCCVAGELQVPLCIGGIKASGMPDGGLQCLGDTSKLTAKGTGAPIEASLAPKCKIGCCDPLPTIAVFRNPKLFERALSTVPAATQQDLWESRKQLLAMSNPMPEQLRTFASAVSAKLAAAGYCLFCCKWDF